MKKGQCPKCGSRNVWVDHPIPKAGMTAMPVSFWSGARLDNYVCVECGFVESYVSDARMLGKIAEKWAKVQPG